MPITNSNDVQQRFDEAARLGVSPTAWVPPEWTRIQKAKSKFDDTPPDLPVFDAGGGDERIKKGREIDKKAPDSPDSMPSDELARKAWVSPFTDFTHVDDREFSRSDVDLISSSLNVGDGYSHIKLGVKILEKHRDEILQLLQDRKDQRWFDKVIDDLRGLEPGGEHVFKKAKQTLESGEINGAITQAITEPTEIKAFGDLMGALSATEDFLNRVSAVNRLKRIVGEDTAGMKRLERVFEWVLYRATDLLRDLNDSVNNQDAYTEARETYIEFLRDLDDHEPVLGRKRLDPCGGPSAAKSRRSGYGATIKWTCLQPVIKGGEIIGARVICQWNPHSSSSGISIQH